MISDGDVEGRQHIVGHFVVGSMSDMNQKDVKAIYRLWGGPIYPGCCIRAGGMEWWGSWGLGRGEGGEKGQWKMSIRKREKGVIYRPKQSRE